MKLVADQSYRFAVIKADIAGSGNSANVSACGEYSDDAVERGSLQRWAITPGVINLGMLFMLAVP